MIGQQCGEQQREVHAGPATFQAGCGAPELTSSQNSRKRTTRSPGALPAMSALLMAPMEVPATQFGAMCSAASASNTPAW
jgi:hypothetical protein